jgi:hypothetical protein
MPVPTVRCTVCECMCEHRLHNKMYSVCVSVCVKTCVCGVSTLSQGAPSPCTVVQCVSRLSGTVEPSVCACVPTLSQRASASRYVQCVSRHADTHPPTIPDGSFHSWTREPTIFGLLVLHHTRASGGHSTQHTHTHTHAHTHTRTTKSFVSHWAHHLVPLRADGGAIPIWRRITVYIL